jgi:uncharacterized membrane protein
VAKGAEGYVSGLIGRLRGGKAWAVTIGIGAGGSCMIVTYFVAELLVLDVGLGKALAEVPINVGQVVLGGLIGALLSYYVKKSYPSLTPA